MRSETFLSQYRVLEGLLEARYARSARANQSVVMEFLHDEDSQSVREKLDMCREIRNLLTHTAASDGSAFVEPSEEALTMLREVIAFVRQPLLAMKFATPVSQILLAKPQYFVLRTMRAMQERGISHVPVMNEGRVTGVFSVSTVFSAVLDEPDVQIDETTRISRFREHLPIDRHLTERFLFADADATYGTVKAAFERPERHGRLAAIFITDTGDPRGDLLGIVTPWDVLGRVQGEGTLIEQ